MASDLLTIRRRISFSNDQRGRRKVRAAPTTTSGAPSAAVPRISRLMALAIALDEMVRTGRVTGYAELARLAHVSRSRLTQITTLTNLASDIQEALLLLTPTGSASDRLTERQLRQVVAVADWEGQRSLCHSLTHPPASPPSL